MDDKTDHIRTSELFKNAKRELDCLAKTAPRRKPPTQFEVIAALYTDTIKPLLDRGFTVPQVRESLVQAGWSITESSLRSGLSRLRTTANGGAHRKRKPRKTKRNLQDGELSKTSTPVASNLKAACANKDQEDKNLATHANAPRRGSLRPVDEQPKYQRTLISDANSGFKVYADREDL